MHTNKDTVIQGTADIHSKLTVEEVAKTLDFCVQALLPTEPRKRDAVMEKVQHMQIDAANAKDPVKATKDLEAVLNPEEMKVYTSVRAREMVRREEILNIDTFNTDVIDGLTANVTRGSLGLVAPSAKPGLKEAKRTDLLSLMMREKERFDKQPPVNATELSATDIKNEGIPVPSS